MATMFSPAWERYFGLDKPARASAASAPAAPAAPPPFRRVSLVGIPPFGGPAARDGGTRAPHPAAGAGAPPRQPTPPIDRRPLPPEPPRRKQELAWLTWQMPEPLREAVSLNLRQTLDWRAQYCQPLDEPKTPAEYTRFGLLGEQLVPKGAVTVCKTLREDLRETIRTLEATQPWLVRNRLLAMHSVRLGQLCAELEQRGLDALEEARSGLARLWD